MLAPVGTGVLRYTYPMGDTPAVCLTQDIPPSFRLRARSRAYHGKEDEKELEGKEAEDNDKREEDGKEEDEKEEDYGKEEKEQEGLEGEEDNEKRQTEDKKREKEKEQKEKENDKDNDSDNSRQEAPINILLLGCGDLRKILFTIHHDARNILFLTILIDKTPLTFDFLTDLFPIYYNLYLPPRLASLVASQARKLVDISDSLQAWHASPYGGGSLGGGLCFCDSHSLLRVREMWQCWACFDGGNEPANTDLKAKFEANLADARDVKADEERLDSTVSDLVYTAVRSAAPSAQEDDMRHLDELHQWFWKSGCVTRHETAADRREDTQVNPMFVTPDSDGHVRMHWGLDPLLGFPLAEAFVRNEDEPEPEIWEAEGMTAHAKVVSVVVGSFALWCQSFQKAWAERKRKVVMRWFVGDAITFGHTLQGLARGVSSRSTHWYRSRHSFLPLRIDGEDYKPGGSLTTCPAPLSFMVIDTSNLIDDLGALNVLMATSPLLENSAAATIYTEMLTRYHRTYKGEADNLLCGPLSTVALLLGLVCVEHFTNTAPYPGATQDAMAYNWIKYGSALPPDMPSKLYQTYERLRWKRPMAH
ncbi:hypothetical protein SMACR_07739 [Sordaria macrospora]|uniref:WGS project CABT00000000 data, contig 2.47 n=2 Tax=Sordaria macrospora TaxID=5147 RepID=F7W8W0_SORMK|nr:uncharacterized protein SMAC_07739 [Sordaria macrospora k-hell]KAA8630722.1 hypothetical protein SMACR_07739 [Sordaria macrospora]WPJ66408.1 hypothetical protein SMAC4_07739 [Sordaria macrospora]CCC05083.1 unnamed protein product [Sordaria macrospora k-hell]